MATVPKSTMVQGKTTVTAGGSPQIIQTSSGAAMATAVAGAGGDKKFYLFFRKSWYLRNLIYNSVS